MIISKTPLRVSFFGGGTDLPIFSNEEFGCVISSTIDKYIYLVSHKAFGNKNILVYSKKESVENIDDIENTRIREIMKEIGIKEKIEIHSLADVPAGTGLGSSSSFSVGLFNLLHSYKGETLSKKDLAIKACNIEINKLGEPIGKQDQFAASFGGFNFIKFNTDGSVDVEKINISKESLDKINERMVVFYLDRIRDASSVLSEQNKNVSSDRGKFKVMVEMKKIAIRMREELENDNIENFGKMLHKSWLLKKTLAGGISNETINKIYENGIDSGASGGKVLGAGGGGFILFYCEPEKQDMLRDRLGYLDEFKVNFEEEGTSIIYQS